ncbi:MAG: NADH-quinone oxidoreductase subunit A [Bacteroidota bacterium]|nr:NADH-quinone oxidoreductase subunit A [Bacteroidota bacterium]
MAVWLYAKLGGISFGASGNCRARAVDLPLSVTLPRSMPMLEQYVPVLVMMALGLFFGIVNVLIAEYIGPRRATREKNSTYESGMEPFKTARERFSVKFYMVAMLFILFDIEIVFMYPWAIQVRNLGAIGFVAMVLFMVLLFAGYVYIVKKGALSWE